MENLTPELPALDDAAGIYGSGDAVVGIPCMIIAIAIFLA